MVDKSFTEYPRLELELLRLKLRHRFAIARGSEDVSETLIARLYAGGTCAGRAPRRSHEIRST